MSDDEALVRRGQTLPLDAKQDLAQRGLEIVRLAAIIGGWGPEKRKLYFWLGKQFERGTLKPGGRVVFLRADETVMAALARSVMGVADDAQADLMYVNAGRGKLVYVDPDGKVTSIQGLPELPPVSDRLA